MTFLEITLYLLQGFKLTLLLFALTLLFAIPLGLLISFCSMSKVTIIKKITRVLVWIVRGIPLMLQIFIIYYVPGMLGYNVFAKIDTKFILAYDIPDMGRFIAVTIAFAINYAFYFSEIYRGGIEAIPRGQYEAGQVLGLSKWQIFKNIVLKQVVKNILPPMSNEVITLVKDTALANSILVGEIILQANRIRANEALIWPLFYTGVFYLLFVGILTILFNAFEKKLSYFKA